MVFHELKMFKVEMSGGPSTNHNQSTNLFELHTFIKYKNIPKCKIESP